MEKMCQKSPGSTELLSRCIMNLDGIKDHIFMHDTGNIEPVLQLILHHYWQVQFPEGQQNLIIAWAELHREELLENWELVKIEQRLKKIDGLR